MALIGKVTAVVGQAYITNQFGVREAVKVGDIVEVGDTIDTVDGSQVMLALNDGRAITIQANQSVSFTDDLLANQSLERLDAVHARW